MVPTLHPRYLESVRDSFARILPLANALDPGSTYFQSDIVKQLAPLHDKPHPRAPATAASARGVPQANTLPSIRQRRLDPCALKFTRCPSGGMSRSSVIMGPLVDAVMRPDSLCIV